MHGKISLFFLNQSMQSIILRRKKCNCVNSFRKIIWQNPMPILHKISHQIRNKMELPEPEKRHLINLIANIILNGERLNNF